MDILDGLGSHDQTAHCDGFLAESTARHQGANPMPDVDFASPQWSWPTLPHPSIGLTRILLGKARLAMQYTYGSKKTFLYVYVTFLLLSPHLPRARPIA